ncbi:hypothetical protein Zmor_017179 [Zophobas morio]|uniref:Uncharacterized protein n=1 Tax=Zophobas morio TaxID=2755281 RepID=A0AA38I972_9CUCU|nr:hypothetical protein Zmor_017179 [Zophobas morio]
MGSPIIIIDDDFTIDVEDEDEDDLEIVYEKHINLETEPEWHFEDDTNYHLSCDIHIKEEIDFEDNYIGEGVFMDLDKLKTELGLDFEENLVNIEAEEQKTKDDSVEEVKMEDINIEEEKTKLCSIDSIEEEKTKDNSIEQETTVIDEKKTKFRSIDSIEEENTKDNSIKQETIIHTVNSIEQVKTEHDSTEKEAPKEDVKVKVETKYTIEEKENKFNIKKEDTEIKTEDKQEKPKKYTVKSNIVKDEKPTTVKKEKSTHKKPPKPFRPKHSTHAAKPQNNHSTQKQQKPHRNKNRREPLDRRKPHKYKNKSRNDPPKTSMWNRRRRLGSNSFYEMESETRPQGFWNGPSMDNQNACSDWQTYSAILGALNQALEQQMAQNAQVERSLVPYVPRSRRRRKKQKWMERWQNRPNVWASGCGNGGNSSFLGPQSQFQGYSYTNILQAVSQLSGGGVVQSNQVTCINNVTFQSFMDRI